MIPDDGLRQLRLSTPFSSAPLATRAFPSRLGFGDSDPIRRAFRQLCQSSSCPPFGGIESPLKNWKPGQIDFTIVVRITRGNTQTLAARSMKARKRNGVQQTVFTRRGVNRVLRFAF